MARFKITFSSVGQTHTIIEAEDEEDARAEFEEGLWTAADPHFDFYEIDDVEEIMEEEPDQEERP